MTKKKKHIWPKQRRVRRMRALRVLSSITVLALFSSVTGAIFIAPSAVEQTSAEETILCMSICPSGSGSCSFGECGTPPTVTTDSISSITATKATANGTVSDDGSLTISERGFALATTSDPTVSDTVYTASGTTGSYSKQLTSLATSTSYYVRAYAVNSQGTAYGQSIQFTTGNGSSGQNQNQNNNQNQTQGGSGPPSGSLGQSQVDLRSVYIDGEPLGVEPRVGIVRSDSENLQQQISQFRSTVYSERIVLTGSTNIKNAFIYLTIFSDPIYGVTRADTFGNWSYVLPRALEPGVHFVTVEAVSPVSPYAIARNRYEFSVVQYTGSPLPAEPEVVRDTEEPEIVPAEPEEGISWDDDSIIEVPVGDRYVQQVRTIGGEDRLEPSEYLDVETEIISLNPDSAEEVILRYTIYDESGARIYIEEKSVFVRSTATDISRLALSAPLQPGTYIVVSEVLSQSGTYRSTQEITIESPLLIDTPLLALSAVELREGLIRLSMLLSVALTLFLVMLYREYRLASGRRRHVFDKDLYDSGMIT